MGTMPSEPTRATREKAGRDMSKCTRGKSHHPPLLLAGQKLVTVTVTAARAIHHFGSALASHVTWKHAPHASPPPNSTPLTAAVFTPKPACAVLSYPHAPPINIYIHVSSHACVHACTL